MAFGKGYSSDDYDFRAVPLGIGALTNVKSNDLLELRTKCLEVKKEIGALAFSPEPLKNQPTKKWLLEQLVVFQKTVKGLNKAYVERMRTDVITAVAEQNSRYFGSLVGRLAHCSSIIPEADRAKATDENPIVRRYFHVPVVIQDVVTENELRGLEAFASEAVALFKRVIVSGDTTGLTANQAIIVRDIHARVHEKHRPPTFGADDTWITLPLDYRIVSGNQKKLDAALKWTNDSMQSLLLVDQANVQYSSFLAISHPTPRGEAIKLPMNLKKEQFHHLCGLKSDGSPDKRFVASSFTLGIGPGGAITLKAVIVQKKQAPRELKDCKHVIGRDYGMKNTITLSVRRLPQTSEGSPALDAEKIQAIQQFTKEQAANFLLSHSLQVDAPVVRKSQRFKADGFLNSINNRCTKIEGYDTRINEAYKALNKEKPRLIKALGFDDESVWLTKEMALRGHPEFEALRQFLDTYNTIGCLKRARRQAYKKIELVKKHWFGFLANIEVKLAQEYDAVIVREDLTYVTIEKEDPAYRGRKFNKMVNHTARGKYQRRASDKFKWNGIPELAIPSYYTSTTCYEHARVHESMRNGDKFTCPHCKVMGRQEEHADEHAADTISAYLLLTKVEKSDTHIERSPHA